MPFGSITVLAFAAVATAFSVLQLGLAATQGWLYGRRGVLFYADQPYEFLLTVIVDAAAALFFAAVFIVLYRKYRGVKAL
ncbi:hypothetical protein SAMN02745157_2336 [Kaistia soli DSM 19436]|uniref:Uncharacterized protein n=2 Tax=Kaistia TaxID=166953 RepID=A0A1M5CFK6_9HYPH|nr:hypothetical protein SAMN02745157_2336 [Kaistia soli DSM 19436]